jgi:hypothetical protein
VSAIRINKTRLPRFVAVLIDSSLSQPPGAESLINENSTLAVSLLREKIKL